MQSRLFLLICLLALVLPAAARATPPPCRLVTEADKREQRVQEAIEQRKGFELPHSHALVARLDSHPAARRRAMGLFPMRVVEAAYFRDRERASRDADRVGDRLRTSDPRYAQLSIEDAYPRPAYVRLLLTRRPAAAELRRLRDGVRRLEIGIVPRSHRSLGRQIDRVFDAAKALAAEGIELQTGYQNPDRGSVTIEFSSNRDDAAAVLRERFGPNLVAIRRPATYESCTQPGSFRASADGRTLTLTYATSTDSLGARVQLLETANSVSVAIVETLPAIDGDVGTTKEVDVQLAAPLAGRRVVSTITRRTVAPYVAPPPPAPIDPGIDFGLALAQGSVVVAASRYDGTPARLTRYPDGGGPAQELGVPGAVDLVENLSASGTRYSFSALARQNGTRRTFAGLIGGELGTLPSGSENAVTTPDGTVSVNEDPRTERGALVFRPASGKERRVRLPGRRFGVVRSAGAYVAVVSSFATEAPRILVFSRRTGRALYHVDVPGLEQYAIAPNGRIAALVSSAKAGAPLRIVTASAQAPNPKTLTTAARTTYAFAFSGERVAFERADRNRESGGLVLVDLAGRQTYSARVSTPVTAVALNNSTLVYADKNCVRRGGIGGPLTALGDCTAAP